MTKEKYERVPETEAFLDTLDNNHIFRDMRNEFDKYSEDYIPEIHNEIVADYASKKYDLSKEEALELYTFFEGKLTELYSSWK